MARTNTPLSYTRPTTHEGAPTDRLTAYKELRRTVLTCMLWENTAYEDGSSIAERIAALVPKVHPEKVIELAYEARTKMHLRHTPLFLIRELARIQGTGKEVERGLYSVIQRADELAEFVSMYWKDGKQPLTSAIKRALAQAFTKFGEYDLAKYDQKGSVKLRDVLFLCHAKPYSEVQGLIWKRLIAGTMAIPDTWETQLSAGKDKKQTFERLLREGKLGGLAVLRNLRNMESAGVDRELIKTRLGEGITKALPFRFITAAQYAPALEPALEAAMLKGLEGVEGLPGKTVLLIDVSGSMNAKLSEKSETTRLDAACGLAILLREKSNCEDIITFSADVKRVPARRGFALRDAINQSQPHASTYLGRALQSLDLTGDDRIIVITDEQTQDPIPPATLAKSYIVNVAPYKNGIGYNNGWTHINGWSDAVVEYIRQTEEG
jgi:TROVE domain-containing protein